MSGEKTCLMTKVRVSPEANVPFSDWQAKLNEKIAIIPHFESLEISTAPGSTLNEWNIVQRFSDAQGLTEWHNSEIRKELLQELRAITGESAIAEEESTTGCPKDSVTEVLFTQVSPDKEKAYRNWMAKIHQAEAKFPGFKGVYIQSPNQKVGGTWITLLQFDTQVNLDRWLNSKEREAILEEAAPLLTSLESHRVVSPYAGWFASLTKDDGQASAWKQSMIVLLTLYPLVMLEKIFLNPRLTDLQPALAVFIGNVLSVALLAWPMVPLAIYFLGWWLSPHPKNRLLINIAGTILLLALYCAEIAILWNF